MKFWRNNILHLAKIIILSILDALAVWSATILFTEHKYIFLSVLIIVTVIINFVYLSKKTYALRYILPGTFFMILLVVYPIIYTVYVSFTNYGTGNILTKPQVINQIENRYYLPEDTKDFNFKAYKIPDQKEYAVLLENEEGKLYLAIDEEVSEVTKADSRFVDQNNDGKIDMIENYEHLDRAQLFKNLSVLQNLEFFWNDNILKMKSISKFSLYRQQYKYVKAEDKIIDLKNNISYLSKEGSFTSPEGETLLPGYRANLGWENYLTLFTDSRVSGPFLRVFIWTFEWAILSVLTTFVLGLFLAILLNDKTLKFRKFYRVILILPYALPAFISVLIWRGLLNTEVGVINQILNTLSLQSIPWLQSVFWSRFALVVINLWLGFPYMMLISLGSLQSISGELYEAASIDGASAWQRFKFITLPLILVSLGPLLISSFAFNFNNFNVIYLFNEGGPPIVGAQTPAGGTDILISYTYRLSFESGRGADFGLASTVSIIIFMITAVITWFNFKYTGALEEVKENV
ncbi:MAG: maltose ABC transporter permease MalF [Halanaerobiales bacterium]|nr:maltose ABC transporter permease MalF [Halanaerobiales bacterium]